MPKHVSEAYLRLEQLLAQGSVRHNQMPVDPMGQITGHRPVNFWGRSLLDQLLRLLPELLADEGVA